MQERRNRTSTPQPEQQRSETLPPHKLAGEQLRVAFQRFVGRETGLPQLAQTPAFLTETGDINPAWQQATQARNRKIANEKPGKLVYCPQNDDWQAVDPQSPVGKIQQLKEAAEVTPQTPSTEATFAKEARRRLVEIYNDYAGPRFNGTRDVVNGKDFRGIHPRYLQARSLSDWRGDLVRTRQQAVQPVLFERWDGAKTKKLTTPSLADKFCHELFSELARAGIKAFPTKDSTKQQAADTKEPPLSESARLFRELLTLPQARGYRELANLFYAGNMLKTYQNLSAVAEMTGQHFPDGWQQFQGSTSEFRSVSGQLEDVSPGIDGYLHTADALYKGNMKKTYENLSAVAKMTGQHFPDGWQAFNGSTSEFRSVSGQLEDLSPGIDSYLQASDTLYKGNMKKTYQNLSAVAEMTGQHFPDGWQAFNGSTSEFRSVSGQLEDLSPGIDGYLQASDALYKGNMKKTYENLSAVAKMTGQHFPDGWQQFQGSTSEFRTQMSWVREHPNTTAKQFMDQFSLKSKHTARMNLATLRKALPSESTQK